MSTPYSRMQHIGIRNQTTFQHFPGNHYNKQAI